MVQIFYQPILHDFKPILSRNEENWRWQSKKKIKLVFGRKSVLTLRLQTLEVKTFKTLFFPLLLILRASRGASCNISIFFMFVYNHNGFTQIHLHLQIALLLR